MKTIAKIIYTLIGFVLILIILWNRLLRERLPRDIPFNLTFITFFCLLFTCIILVIVLVTLFTKYKVKQNFALNIIKKSYEAFNNFATRDLNIKNIITTIQLKIIMFFHRNETYMRSLHISVKFIQTLIVIILFIEVFFFNHIKYFYSATTLLLVSLLYKYLIFMLESLYKEQIAFLESCISIHYIPKNAEDYKDHWDYARNYKIVSAEQWVMDMNMMRLKLIVLSPKYKIITKIKSSYIESILPMMSLKEKLRKFNYKAATLEAEGRAATVLNIYGILYKFSSYKKKFELFFICLHVTLYLICWSYILIKSFHTLPAGAFDIFIPKHENPFV